MSRWEGTCMASHRTFTPGTTATAAAYSPTSSAPPRDATQASGGRALTRAALYARVSTEKQEREETVASQVDLLQQTAKARGYEVLPGNLFIDDGVSGTRLDRPALERLRDLAAEGTFEVVLVTAPDRLARRYAYQVVLVEELTRQGCEVVFVQQSLGASPAEQMLLQMQGVFAEYERALIHERTRRGQLFAARQGRVNWGNPPYGYTYIHKTTTTPQHLVVNEAEAEVVRQIYRWCVEEQLSSYAMQRRLTMHGLPRDALQESCHLVVAHPITVVGAELCEAGTHGALTELLGQLQVGGFPTAGTLEPLDHERKGPVQGLDRDTPRPITSQDAPFFT